MLDSYHRSKFSFMFLRNNRKAVDLYVVNVDGCCYEGDLTISLMFVLQFYSNCMIMFYISLQSI